MKELLNGQFFQHMGTAHYLWLGLVAALTISFLATTYHALSRRSRGEPRYRDLPASELAETVMVECAACGWKGEVPRLHKRCPHCGQSNFL